jgi:RNA polymerase primary sigma factor
MREPGRDAYYRELASCRPMAREEEKLRATELAELRARYEALRDGPEPLADTVACAEREWRHARDRFVCANLRLVVRMASRYTSNPQILSDLVQEGNLGLLTAVDRFDHTRGVRFCTYAAWWIRHRIMRGLNDTERPLRVPSHMSQAAAKLIRMKREHEVRHGASPSNEQLAKRAELSVGKVERAMAVARGRATSLESPISANDGRTLRDTLSDGRQSMVQRLVVMETQRAVNDALDKLPAVERDILRRRFAFDGPEPLTLREIGVVHSLSRERIRQLQNRALSRVRDTLDSVELVAS